MDDLRKALFRALRKSDVNMLRAVLAQGVSLDFHDGDVYPVFHDAIICGCEDLDVLEMLLAAGADPQALWAENGTSVLHWVAHHAQPDALNWFLAHGLDVNATSIDGTTPLMTAILAADWTGDPDDHAMALRDIRILLAAGADVKRADGLGSTALHSAAMRGLDDVAALLLDHGADVEARDATGDTPLLQAVSHGKAGVLALLLSRGAAPSAQGAKGFGALHDLASRGPESMTAEHVMIVEKLIAAGVAPDMADEDGRTALWWAASSNNVEMARLLLSHGADANAANGYALLEAMAMASDEMTDALLAAGASTALSGHDAFDWGDLPLMVAASIDYTYGITALLDHGAAVDAQTIDGETALLIAVRQGSHASAALLLQRGADREHTDRYGNTPLGWAMRRQDADMITRLKQK